METIKLDFKNLFKEFLQGSDIVTIEEDAIQNFDTISEDEKRELMSALERVEKIAEKSTGIPKSIKKVNHKQAIQKTLDQNPIKVDSKTKNVIEEKEDIERE